MLCESNSMIPWNIWRKPVFDFVVKVLIVRFTGFSGGAATWLRIKRRLFIVQKASPCSESIEMV